MPDLVIRKYKQYQIHFVNGTYKYDVYDQEGKWLSSTDSLKDAKLMIQANKWAKETL